MTWTGRFGTPASLLAAMALTLTMAALLLLAAFARPALAATITVNTTADDTTNNGNCSLREAVIAANTDAARDACRAGSGADTITLPAGTYALSIAGNLEDNALQGDLDVLGSVTINGAGAGNTTVNGSDLDRVFDVWPGSTVVFSGLTITNGFAGTGAGIFRVWHANDQRLHRQCQRCLQRYPAVASTTPQAAR